jgi:hypothetical protein
MTLRILTFSITTLTEKLEFLGILNGAATFGRTKLSTMTFSLNKTLNGAVTLGIKTLIIMTQ